LDRENPSISQRRQVELLAVARSPAGYQPVPVSGADRQVIRIMDTKSQRSTTKLPSGFA
jgi:hypothetical protein